MASITYDAQSFTVDGRRIWLVSGTVHYARLPRGLWADRLRAAKQAGLNCIEVPVVWSIHEPQPGRFNFTDDADLNAFVTLIGELGMYAIIRIGPYIGDGYDMGGLPPWLLDQGAQGLRQNDPVYLQCVARYVDAAMNQVVKLMVTEPTSGPIVAVQTEHEWLCHNEQQAAEYLQPINRFVRESGCKVPLLNRNRLFQQVAGTIDTWAGAADLLANCRQLRAVQRDAPAIVMSLPTAATRTWGAAETETVDATDIMRNMAEVSAAHGMFNLDPICAGTNLAHLGGRLADGDDAFCATTPHPDAPISDTGRRTAKYTRIKRLATFITQFESVFASAEPSHHTVAATGVSVVHQHSSLGDAVFAIRDDRTASVELTAPKGESLDVHFGKDAVAWILLGANLGGVARLDLTNLRPFAFLDKQLLVMFGPSGSPGIVSINGAIAEFNVPTGSEPHVVIVDDIAVAVLNEKQVDAAYLAGPALRVGIAGFDAEGKPIDHPDFATRYTVASDGGVSKSKRKPAAKTTAPKFTEWWVADTTAYTTGKAPRFATLDGPKPLEACGADHGYGWYRIAMDRPRAKKVKLMIPESADRLHLFRDGKLMKIVGSGPGADAGPLTFEAPAGKSELVVLADNLGRFSEDLPIDRPTGLCGDLLSVTPARLGKGKVSEEPCFDVFELNGYVPGADADDRTVLPRYTFELKLTTKQRHVITLSGDRPRSVLIVNNEPIAVDPGCGLTQRFVVGDMLKKGSNKIVLAMIDPIDESYDADKSITVHRVDESLTEGADFWYARWQAPDDKAYVEYDASAKPIGPAFFAGSFTVGHTDAPLCVDIVGGTKGHLYLNGHNLGRYFVATATGKKVEGQTRYYLPEPLLDVEGENELVFFDEHGKPPVRSKLVFDDGG